MGLRRAVHFVPGANEKMFRKALELPADALILDLEDAVTPENKESARETVTAWLREADFGGRERLVRMNPLDTPWGVEDLEGTMLGRPDAYVVPKARGREELEQIDEILGRIEKERGLPPGEVTLLVIATETPDGLLNIRELAGSSRVDALTWGAEDLSAAIGARRNRDESGAYLEIFRLARHLTLLAACAAGVQPIDGVFVDIRDSAGLERECRESAQMGFTGKMTIHPSQVEIVNAAFSPSAEEIAESQELVAAFEDQQRAGRMAFAFKGNMVDAPHLARARTVLERARLDERRRS